MVLVEIYIDACIFIDISTISGNELWQMHSIVETKRWTKIKKNKIT